MSGLCATLKNLHFILEMLESVKQFIKSDLQFIMSALAVGVADRAQKVLFHVNKRYFSYKLSLAPMKVRGVRLTHPH